MTGREGGTYLLFWPRGWALVRGRALIRAWALIRGNKVVPLVNSIDFHLKVTNILMNGSFPGLPEIKGFDLTALTQDDLQNLQP